MRKEIISTIKKTARCHDGDYIIHNPEEVADAVIKEMIKEIESIKRNENMERVSTATEIRINDNHTYNQALDDIIKKIKEL